MSKSTLHTLNKAPADTVLWSSCLAAIQPNDTLLLIEDAVYAAVDTHIERTPTHPAFFYLKADIEARGLLAHVNPNRLIDDDQFVTLSCAHSKVVSWF